MNPQSPRASFGRMALFFVPLVLVCVSQGLTYPFVASIVSHGPLGVNEFTAYSMGQSAVFLVGTVCAAMVTTGMMFCRSREGLREYARLNGALLAASVIDGFTVSTNGFPTKEIFAPAA